MDLFNLKKLKKQNVLWLVLGYILYVGIAGYYIVDNTIGMLNSETSYEYCEHLCFLVEKIARLYFFTLFFVVIYLVYINKVYSKWTIRLFFMIMFSAIIYFMVADYVFDYVCDNINADDMSRMTFFTTTLYSDLIYPIAIFYSFVPMFIKDNLKLKKEQELTI